MFFTRLTLLSALNTLGLLLQASAAGNRTIDDSSTEFSYTGNWLVNSCPSCGSQPDSAQAHAGTWHASNSDGTTVKLQFTGSAVWVFGILAPAANQGSLTITLDSQPPVVYNSSGSANSSFTYNELLFTASSLSVFTHVLTLKPSVDSDSGHSVLVDYAVVNTDIASTTPTPSPTSSTSSSPDLDLGKIIGPVVGAFVALSILGWFYRLCCRPRVETVEVVQPAPVTVYEETTVMMPVTAMRPVTVYR